MSLEKLLKLSRGPFLLVSNLIFRAIILPNFGRYLLVKNRITKKTSNFREKLLLTFTNQYVIHLIIILISILVTTSNILAYERRENYGQNSLIYQVIGLEGIEILQDTTTTLEEPKVYSYLGETFQVGTDVYSEAQRRESELSKEQADNSILVTEGGVTLSKPDLVSTEGAKVTRTTIKKYEVATGDVIGNIASKFGVSVETILWANNLTSRSYIKPGQELIIPPTTGVLHTIKKGDTLKSIANKYDASSTKIIEFNNIKDDSLLVIGDTLMIPGGRIIYTSAPRAYVAPTTPAPTYTAPVVSSNGGMVWPNGCSRITQYFKGWLHTGIDIACPYGTPIVAAADGVVSRVQYLNTGYGYNIIIDHGSGKQTLYGHASWIGVVVGQHVNQGEVIAKEGSTGRSTGPHLHFEVRINGSQLNPLSYIR
ncbi:peptidoglycan DD-metalloendopeptidase family protein [Candidatus Falkowbacteria bacterium]|nr:peptidoglycan DD-metalloendopeptidase family protein [Candidatus Falkowbacteria bacterium]